MIKTNNHKKIYDFLIGQPLYRGFSLCNPSDNHGGHSKKVLIQSAIDGEIVRAKLVDERRDYSIAHLIDVIKPSQYRVIPQCSHYYNCGGCQYQHINYEKQIHIKQKILKDCIKRIAKIDIELNTPIIGTPWHYRYRGNFKAEGKKLGFFRQGTRDLIGVKQCLLMNNEINEALKLIRDVITDNYQGEITIIGSKEILILFKPKRHLDKKLNACIENMNHLRIKALISGHNDSTSSELHRIDLGLKDMHYYVSPYSFFQSNWKLNLEVIDTIKTEVDFEKKTVCDIYAGSGNFTLSISDKASFVYAYEDNLNAIQDAKYNALLNRISNCEFFCHKAEDIDINQKIDIVIVNPPRLGMSKTAMTRLLKIMPATIIYMSCDPSTLSRDIQRMSNSYRIKSIRLIDFFPHTYHIETLAILDKS